MNAQVITVSNKKPTQSYYRFDLFLESLRRYGETAALLGWNEPWYGLMTKPLLLRQFLRDKKYSSDRLIVCDAWDIIFCRHPHDIGDRCAEQFGDALVFNAEKSCWPRTDLMSSFPETGTSWRYLNSGFMCGPPEKILTLLESMNLDAIGVDCVRPDGSKSEPNDQGEFQAAFAKQPVKMVVDGKCSVSQTFSSCSLNEFELLGDRIKNKETGSFPGVLHFNGGSKNDIMPAVHKMLNLA